MTTIRGVAIIPIALRLLVIVVFVAGQSAQWDGSAFTGRGLLAAGLTMAAAGALAAAPLSGASRMRRPVTLLGIPVRIGAAVVASLGLLAISPDAGPAIIALLLAVGIAAFRYPLGNALTVGLLALTGLLLVGVTDRHWDQELILGFNVCVVFLVAYAIRQRRAVRKAEAREAVLAERARIAREIHDILAHSLSAQIVHLEGARLLLCADRTEEAMDRVERARNLAKAGLEEARRAVSALREDSPPLPAALQLLAEEFRATTGQDCVLTVTGAERRLTPETELTVIRTAQEALTNVGRHAPGAAAAVRLGFQRGAFELEVTNPAGSESGVPGGGYGLVGMAERAELLGGDLEAGDVDGGFRVRLRLPVPAGRELGTGSS
ncbi:sensor histidine kinase [Streptosporangium sp. NBC_01756]|uniref:sensor histidine kinase n=1 Tax=Streptosporangium sp. NBC_01756 TaxID=2975950 RepID=UPI002DD98339|nr:histidine kinase [Streptosporangium sp. NBC_01756]WSC87183.1 histidine kinase [Streptosporangium sp. NBC_01756]